MFVVAVVANGQVRRSYMFLPPRSTTTGLHPRFSLVDYHHAKKHSAGSHGVMKRCKHFPPLMPWLPLTLGTVEHIARYLVKERRLVILLDPVRSSASCRGGRLCQALPVSLLGQLFFLRRQSTGHKSNVATNQTSPTTLKQKKMKSVERPPSPKMNCTHNT